LRKVSLLVLMSLVLFAGMLASALPPIKAQYLKNATAKFYVKLPNGGTWENATGVLGIGQKYNITVGIANVTKMIGYGVTFVWNSTFMSSTGKYWLSPFFKAERDAGNWSSAMIDQGYPTNNLSKTLGLSAIPPTVGAFRDFGQAALGIQYNVTGTFDIVTIEFVINTYGPEGFYLWKDPSLYPMPPNAINWPQPYLQQELAFSPLYGTPYWLTNCGWKDTTGVKQPYDVVWCSNPLFSPPAPLSGSVANAVLWAVPAPLPYPPLPDVAVTGVTLSSDFAYVGENVSISADIRNLGFSCENANVFAYADKNSTVIGDEITIGAQLRLFPAASFSTLNFVWNTTSVPAGNYTISVLAHSLTQDADLTNNLYIGGKIEVSTPIFIPLNSINITCPSHVELNPPIFNFNYTLTALQASIGSITIKSTGYTGQVVILGSKNDSIHLCVGQPSQKLGKYYLLTNSSITAPLWLLFETGPGAHDWSHYQGMYEMQLRIGGNLKLSIAINIVQLDVCHNGAVSNAGGTVTFSQTVSGSGVYLVAKIPPGGQSFPIGGNFTVNGWKVTVDPPLGTLFGTPHKIAVNITAPPGAAPGTTFSVTLEAYDNATGQLIWDYTFFSSVNPPPPTIEAVQLPASTPSGLLFNATVEDTAGIENVTLCYSVNNGQWNNQTMQLKSGNTFNSSIFVSTIPSVRDGTTLKYYIIATPWLGSQARSPQSGNYTITVKNDLAAITVKSTKTIAGKGICLVPINLTIANYGTLPATSLEVYFYANNYSIYTENVPFIKNGTTRSLMFYWNSSGFAYGNYTLSGFVSAIVNETNTSNNLVPGNILTVTIPGDVNGDRRVNWDDLSDVGYAYGTKPGDLLWNPNADIDSSGKVTWEDLTTVGWNYGKKW
jgi:hypothetical protein